MPRPSPSRPGRGATDLPGFHPPTHRPVDRGPASDHPTAGGAHWCPRSRPGPAFGFSPRHGSTHGDTAPRRGTPLHPRGHRSRSGGSGVRFGGAAFGSVEWCAARWSGARRDHHRPPGPARLTARPTTGGAYWCGRPGPVAAVTPRRTAIHGTLLHAGGHRSRDGDTAPGRAGAVFALVERRSGPRSGVRCGGALPCGTTTGRRARLDRRPGLARPNAWPDRMPGSTDGPARPAADRPPTVPDPEKPPPPRGDRRPYRVS